uniref:AB hydrolase-1 domain-containing protein n=1 Tax=Vannella robusta TaxID=1487602 RepID=A0A7S4MSZ8_9EUKA|mmetsp:Transcript_8748/g.10814  ORF Transcript_8748/g.10814 Transcript_8748/m.10814 type:complete len:303 (+) Transcript_8748:354-1262(+)
MDEPLSENDCGTAMISPGVEIYYELYGQGDEKVLLVMGLGTSATAWVPTVKWLAQHETDFQFCIFDNRGVGRSSVPPGRYKTSMMAQDAIKLADYLKWDKFHVAGVSMGGMISQEIALAAPTRVCTLNLAVTHSGGSGSFPVFAGVRGILQSQRCKTAAEKAPHILNLMYTESFLKAEVDGMSNVERLTNVFLESVKKLPPPNEQGMRSQVLAVNTHSVGKKRLQKLKESGIPILVCTGDTDKLVNPKASLYLRSVLNPVEFILWEDCGHGVITQRFDDYNAALIRHCRRRLARDMSTKEAS